MTSGNDGALPSPGIRRRAVPGRASRHEPPQGPRRPATCRRRFRSPPLPPAAANPAAPGWPAAHPATPTIWASPVRTYQPQPGLSVGRAVATPEPGMHGDMSPNTAPECVPEAARLAGNQRVSRRLPDPAKLRPGATQHYHRRPLCPRRPGWQQPPPSRTTRALPPPRNHAPASETDASARSGSSGWPAKCSRAAVFTTVTSTIESTDAVNSAAITVTRRAAGSPSASGCPAYIPSRDAPRR